MMNLPAIKQIAHTAMADKRSSPYYKRGDKYTHGERVAVLAVRLRRLILPLRVPVVFGMNWTRL
jgi:hypothetical protein